ncbi:MAG: electron transport complex protein RnfA [Ostreibacterium sp.]
MSHKLKISIVTLKDLFHLLISSIFINNLIFVQSLGLCSFVSLTRKIETSISMILATTVIFIFSTSSAYLLTNYLLMPFNAKYLSTITYLTLAATLLSVTNMMSRKTYPLLRKLLGIYLPLITINCSVLGVMLINTHKQSILNLSIYGLAIYGLAISIASSLAIVLLFFIRERLDVADVPKPFQGVPITFITVGLMAIAFMGFSGL